MRRVSFLASVGVALLPAATAAQSNTAAGAFLSYQSGVASSSALGLTLSKSANPLSLRGSGYFLLDDALLSDRGWRPWGVDGDVVLSFGGGSRISGAYAFAGLGTSGRDSLGTMVASGNWSYGLGYALPIGRSFDLSFETRSRMEDFRWPGDPGATDPRREMRFGASYHFGTNIGGRRPTSGGTRRSEPGPVLAGHPIGTTAGARVLPTAEQYLGTPYVWGGSTPAGFDCSGFTQYVFAKHNVKLPRTSRQQASAGTRLVTSWDALAPGDLVMFAESGEAISHVAIYAGDHRIIHSTSSGGGVRYDDIDTHRGEWFATHMVAARRVTPDGRNILDFAKQFVGAKVSFDPPDKAPREKH